MKNVPSPTIKIIEPVETREGSGFSIRRPLPTQHLSEWDPFLQLDELGPENEICSHPHPHRGIEVLTYVLSGTLHYADSTGNKSIVHAGGAHLVTTGSGMIQKEKWISENHENGSPQHGLRIWLNLPPEHKMMQPRYQKAGRADFQVQRTSNDNGTVTYIVDRNESSHLRTVMPLQCCDIHLMEDGHCHLQISTAERAILYVFEGVAKCQGQDVDSGRLLIFPQGETSIEISNVLKTPMRCLFLSAPPCGAQIARYGPFVMNSHADLITAFSDYQKGRMGTLDT